MKLRLFAADHKAFVSQQDLQHARILLVADTGSSAEVSAALTAIMQAQTLWQERVETLKLECLVVVFGPDRHQELQRGMREWQTCISLGTDRPSVLYLGDCCGTLLLDDPSVHAATEVLLALLCLVDYSKASAFGRFRHTASGRRWYVALEQFNLPPLHGLAGTILIEAARAEIDRWLSAEPPTTSDKMELLALLEPWRFGEQGVSTRQYSSDFLTESYERALPELLVRSAKFVSPARGFGPMLNELAAIAEQARTTPLTKVYTPPAAWWRRFLTHLQSLMHRRPGLSPQDLSQSNVVGAASPEQASDPLAEYLRGLSQGLDATVSIPFGPNPLLGSPAPLGHLRGAEQLALDNEMRVELQAFAQEQLRSLTLPALIALSSLVQTGSLNDLRRKAFDAGLKILLELHARIHIHLCAEALQKAGERWLDQSWKIFLYCNQPPPGSDVFSFCLKHPRPKSEQQEEKSDDTLPRQSAFLSPERIFVLRLVGME